MVLERAVAGRQTPHGARRRGGAAATRISDPTSPAPATASGRETGQLTCGAAAAAAWVGSVPPGFIRPGAFCASLGECVTLAAPRSAPRTAKVGVLQRWPTSEHVF